jgi:hypothetical protein
MTIEAVFGQDGSHVVVKRERHARRRGQPNTRRPSREEDEPEVTEVMGGQKLISQ